MAECGVQTFKTSSGSIDARLARFLFHYRTTPTSTNEVSPDELLMGRRLRTYLDKLRPDLATKVYNRQQSQKRSHHGQNKEGTFSVNDSEFVRNYHQGSDWLPGKVLTTGPRNYKVKLSNGTIVQLHMDQMRDH